MADKTEKDMPSSLKNLGDGIWAAPGARIIDRSGRKTLPIGRDGFAQARLDSVLVDKTMLIADVLDSGYAATLFCRPRRFGKTLNMTMMKAFFEFESDSGLDAEALFKGTQIWEAADGRYRRECGTYPVIHLSLRTAKGATWPDTYGALCNLIGLEYARHGYLADSHALDEVDRVLFADIRAGRADANQYADSLATLCRMLRAHHGRHVVLLIDEYDAPVMAGYSAEQGTFYNEMVSFLKRWLTGALKDGGEALQFACLTGVQRISKESIFSDLDNITVSTPLSTDFDERFGFTQAEVCALASYLGRQDCLDEAKEWYDGYRFGRVDAYNPWSFLNYLKQGCAPGVYWLNTSGNSVVGAAVQSADERMLADLYSLVQPGGSVVEPLDLGVVFPYVGVRSEAAWAMLYLAGYLTTDDVSMPTDPWLERTLRIPNREIRRLFEKEIPLRFAPKQADQRVVLDFQRALRSANPQALHTTLEQILLASPSHFDLVSENSYHMLMLGLCFGIEGYGTPMSNRESGHGRYDICLLPETMQGSPSLRQTRPEIVVELKYLASNDAPDDGKALSLRLQKIAEQAVAQIEEKRYGVSEGTERLGYIHWGIAFCGKHCEVACKESR